MSLEKFGDSFINFVYSLAKSQVLGEYDGVKVPNSCLAEALTLSYNKISDHEVRFKREK